MVESDEVYTDTVSRRQFLKGVGAVGGTMAVGGSIAWGDPQEYVEEQIGDLMATVEDDVSGTGDSGADRTKIYMGHLNDYTFPRDDPPHAVEHLLEEDELSVELVHVQEEIDEDEFQRRRQEEFRNYVENLDTFFGVSDQVQEYLNYLVGAVEAVTYPEEEVRDKVSYMMERLADGLAYHPSDTDYVEEILRDMADTLYVDPEDYYIPDESLDEIQSHLEAQYEDLLGEYDIDIDVSVRRLPADVIEEQGYTVEDVLPPYDEGYGTWRETVDAFRDDFGYDGTLPVLLSTRNMGYAFDGRGKDDAAFVHLPVDMLARRDSLDDWAMGRMLKQYLVPHEVGHSALEFPHNAMRNGVMSYNKIPRTMAWLFGDGPEICGWSDSLTHRLITGEDIPAEQADAETVDHTTVFLDDLMKFDVIQHVDAAEWVPEDDVVRYTWTFRDGERTELDVELSHFFDRIAIRSYDDTDEPVTHEERTF